MSTAANTTALQVRLTKRYEVAERTMAFQFEKPDGFVFRAGQSIDMTLINPSATNGEGNGRAFFITSAFDKGMLSGPYLLKSSAGRCSCIEGTSGLAPTQLR